MKLNLWTSLTGTSGYSCHGRNLALALQRAGVDLAIDMQDINPDWKKTIPKELHEAVKRDYSYEKTVAITLPPYLAIKSGDQLPGYYGYCVFEGTKMMPYWVEALNASYLTKVLVPSQYVKQVCIDSGVTKEIVVVPHGFDPAVFKPDGNKMGQFSPDNFNFLFAGGWKDGVRDRKGLDIALKAFSEEFKPTEKVAFYAKINAAYQHPQVVIDAVGALGLPKAKDRGIIELLFNTVTDEVMASTYRGADVLVAPSKGEAFNMPVLEAMACGTPSIVTNYGGQLDYVNEGNGWLLDIDGMAPATGEKHIYQKAEWAVPSVKHLRELMRYCFDNREEVKKSGKQGIEDVKSWSWAESARKLSEAVA